MTTSYPTALDTEDSLYRAVNSFRTTLTTQINASQTAIQVASITGLPSVGLVSIEDEVIKYTGLLPSPPTLVGCSRGFDATFAANHLVNTEVQMRWVADHHNAVTSAVSAIEAELGTTPKGTFPSVSSRLDSIGSTVIPISPVSTDWTFTHSRNRVVLVQLYRKVSGNVFELMQTEVSQAVGTTSVVTITLAKPEEGYIIYS